jgi:hypothetical protein
MLQEIAPQCSMKARCVVEKIRLFRRIRWARIGVIGAASAPRRVRRSTVAACRDPVGPAQKRPQQRAHRPPPGNKLTIFAGYSHIQKAHSSDSYGSAQGDYPLSIGININININSSAEYSLEWVGVAFDKHFDPYAGVNYSQVTDGLANGFAGTTTDGTTGGESQTTTMIGGRLRF